MPVEPQNGKLTVTFRTEERVYLDFASRCKKKGEFVCEKLTQLMRVDNEASS